jgi:hypothetical protein
MSISCCLTASGCHLDLTCHTPLCGITEVEPNQEVALLVLRHLQSFVPVLQTEIGTCGGVKCMPYFRTNHCICAHLLENQHQSVQACINMPMVQQTTLCAVNGPSSHSLSLFLLWLS